VPDPDDDPTMEELDHKRERLSKKNPDIGPLIAQTPGGDEEPESQVGTVFGSGS
jgi:hypothetical protein